MDKYSFSIYHTILYELTNFFKVQRNLLFERIFDGDMQVIKFLRVVGVEFVPSHYNFFDAKLFEKNVVFGCAFIA